MQLQTVQYITLSDEEMLRTRKYMSCCSPVGLTEDQIKVRNRLRDDRKFDSQYVIEQIIPYLQWLLHHYNTEKSDAEEQVKTATGENALGNIKLQWQIIINTREQMISQVKEILELFQSAQDMFRAHS